MDRVQNLYAQRKTSVFLRGGGRQGRGGGDRSGRIAAGEDRGGVLVAISLDLWGYREKTDVGLALALCLVYVRGRRRHKHG